MKIVREHINEKFTEDSDPVEDLGIGTRKQISKFMKERGLEDTDDYALANCAEGGKAKWVKFLLARGADVHVHNEYALRRAADNGHTETVKILLDAGANPHVFGDNPLYWAIHKGHTETVKVLKDHIAKEEKVKKVNEKFVEDSDPIEDLGLTLEARLLKAFQKISNMATLTLRADISDQLIFRISDYSANNAQNFEYYAKILKPFYKEIYILESNTFRIHIKVIIKPELHDIIKETYKRWVNEYYTAKKI